jgi:polyferredoxin
MRGLGKKSSRKGSNRMMWVLGGIVLVLIFVLLWTTILDSFLVGTAEDLFGNVPYTQN